MTSKMKTPVQPLLKNCIIFAFFSHTASLTSLWGEFRRHTVGVVAGTFGKSLKALGIMSPCDSKQFK